jgi:D-serine deaminase-like pyridoxal phosphate-dependent protein
MEFRDRGLPLGVVSISRIRTNIEAMAGRAGKHNLLFRPHFKTHQSAGIGELFRNHTNAVTVSSPGMGLYFARRGWRRITMAFPVNAHDAQALRELAIAANTDFLVSSPEAVGALDGALRGVPAGVWIKVDCGYRRAGIPWDDADALSVTGESIGLRRNMAFRGILTHAGNTYSAGNRHGILEVHRQSLERMAEAKKSVGGGCLVSVGDTPSCSVAESFPGVDEIRPGNFVFHDATQLELGSCGPGEIAFAVLCPVAEVHRDRTVILGGAIHLSRDSTPSGCFGYAGASSEDGFFEPLAQHPVTMISQEHGVVKGVPPGSEPGSVIPVIPAHSCLAAGCFPVYLDEEGNRLERYGPTRRAGSNADRSC